MFGRKGKGGEEEAPRVRRSYTPEGQDNYTFRRSRTISGSSSSSVNASNARRPDLKSDRLRLHELHASKRFLRTSIVLVVLMAFMSGFLLLNNIMFADMRLEASGVPARERKALQEAVTKYVNHNPSQAFIFSLNEQQLAKSLQATHPEVELVKADTAWLSNEDQLIIRFRKPIVVWRINGQQFYVDKYGASFQRNYGLEPSLEVDDAAGYMPELAKEGSVASQKFISYLGQLLGYLRAEDIGPVERVAIPPAPREIDIYLKGKGYPIKTNTDRNPSVQAQDIKQALQYFKKHNITPQYIDARVEGKAFYK